mmetsp:Transcript_25766/g.45371  ORF Transcript_25766/g.45371 Transcript_25766/m.45371 type:complete len:230 (+) Transcript_25766:8354-9043(+)
MQRLERQLAEREREVEILKEKLKTYKEEARLKIEEETRRLSRLIEEGDTRLNDLFMQIEALTARNAELEQRPRRSELERVAAELRIENRRLREQLNSTELLTQEELRDVEYKIKELEQTQDTLLAENKRLRDQLDKKPTLVHLHAFSTTLRKLRFELSQLSSVARAVKRNQPLTLNLIMGVKEDASEAEVTGENSLGLEVDRLKEEVQSLRSCVSDIYAEQCGSFCLTQ